MKSNRMSSSSLARNRRRASRVGALEMTSSPPSYEDAPENLSENGIYEENVVDSVEGDENNRKLSQKAADLADAFSKAVNVRRVLNRWAACIPSKRKIGIKKDGSGTVDVSSDRYVPVSGYVKLNEMGICELGSDVEDEFIPLDISDGVEREKARKHNAKITQSQALLHYFAKLARSDDIDEEIDMEFVDKMIASGADVNTRDVFGQSLLHEVARAWHTSVAEYLIDKGANVNERDYLGRTPLHVAAAVDYPDMIEVLLESGAQLESRTFEEHQTPLHFAARNDASNALIKLVKSRAELEAEDYKKRTPLFVAAELDRSDTARMLLDYGANAGVVDASGMAAIVLMVRKMSPVAKEALDQFHKKDRANRKQMFYLDKVEHMKPEDAGAAQSALQVVVDMNKLDLIMHPIFEKIIEVKWNAFGLRGALFQVCINLLFVISWTVQGLSESSGEPWKYDLPADIWRIALYVVSVTLWLYQFINEIFELLDSRKQFKQWYQWRKEELEKDFKYVHQRWPEEENYLRSELQSLQDQEPSYFRDPWNWFDWITYFILLIQLVMHVVDVLFHHQTLTDAQRGTFAIAIVFVWVRLMKNFRAFRSVGPFIVICTYMIKDIMRWLFVYLIFYIPYCFAFYMIFGGNDIEGYETFDVVVYSLFRMTLVDDYGYEGLEEKNHFMAQILCGTFLSIASIIMLNLFIALMSDTFQRVYDNAQANALLQQASFIQSEEEGLREIKVYQFRDYIHSKCSPLKEYYDDDWEENDDDLKKVTIQIKEQIDEYLEKVEDESRERALDLNDGNLPQDLDLLCQTIQTSSKKETSKLKQEVQGLRQEISELKQLIMSMGGAAGGGAGAGAGGLAFTDRSASSQKQPSFRKSMSKARETLPDEDETKPARTRGLGPKQVSGIRRSDKQDKVGGSRWSLVAPRRRDEDIDEDVEMEETEEVHASPGNEFLLGGDFSEEDVTQASSGGPPQYRSKEQIEPRDDPAAYARPMARGVRQIQVQPDEADQMTDMLARYETMDFGAGQNESNRVAVRTRNINLPPSYNGTKGNDPRNPRV